VVVIPREGKARDRRRRNCPRFPQRPHRRKEEKGKREDERKREKERKRGREGKWRRTLKRAKRRM